MGNTSIKEDLRRAKKIKQAFTLAVENHVESLSNWLETISTDNPAKAIELMTKLADYILPKLQRNDVIVSEVSIEYDYSKLTEEELDTLLFLQEKCKIEAQEIEISLDTE